MGVHVRADHDEAGRLVARKAAWPAEDEWRLVREAAVLAAAEHPGVVRLRGLAVAGGRLELVTDWAGGRTVADLGPLPRRAAARLIDDLAATLTELHARGMAHGRLRPDHVLVGAGGDPVLCGLAEAVVAPAGAAAAPDAVQADLGALDELLGEHGRRRTRRGARHQPVARAVKTLAVVAAATLAGLVAGSAIAARCGFPTSAGPPDPVPVPALEPAHAASAPERPPDAEPSAPPVVELDGHRFAVGAAGDVAATAAWRCDGRDAVLLLRPRTGELFLFEDVDAHAGPRELGPFTREPDAAELVAPAPDHACPTPTVVTRRGEVRGVTLPPVR